MKSEDQAWLDYKERFSDEYDNYNYSSPVQAWVMRASHKLCERDFSTEMHFSRVLEVGAGTGEHFPFVRHTFDQYTFSDLDPKTLARARHKISEDRNDLGFEVQSAGNLQYKDNTFDRLIAVHVLEHLGEPHLVLKEWFRVLKPGGVLSIIIPTDPGIAWRLGRCLGPRKNAVARGMAYDYVMAREHINSCNNIIAILRHYFQESSESWWPFLIPSIDLNLFFEFHTTISK